MEDYKYELNILNDYVNLYTPSMGMSSSRVTNSTVVERDLLRTNVNKSIELSKFISNNDLTPTNIDECFKWSYTFIPFMTTLDYILVDDDLYPHVHCSEIVSEGTISMHLPCSNNITVNSAFR